MFDIFAVLGREYMVYSGYQSTWRCMHMKKHFGFIHDIMEVKILVLYILNRMPDAVTLETLTELVLCDDGIGYFDLVEAIDELKRTEHIKSSGDSYSVTAKGSRNGEATESCLPFSFRLKVESNISAKRIALNRDSMISTGYSRHEDGGFNVKLALSDGIGDIVKLNLYAATEKQAMRLEKGFRRNAENIYKTLISTILS